MKPIDYRQMEGKYIDLEGQEVDPQGENEYCVIVANLWERMTEHGAMQSCCAACKALVGLAPVTQEMLKKNPCRTVLCIDCFELIRRFQAGAQTLAEILTDAIEGHHGPRTGKIRSHLH